MSFRVQNRATRIVAGVFGAVAALAGLEHGLGEILQGPGRPGSLVFASWSGVPLFKVLGGEPALSILPDLVASGVVTVALSLLLLAWTTVARRRVGLGTALICIPLLACGGGFGPPLLGLLVAIVAGRSAAPLAWWRGKAPVALRRLLAGGWPAILACGVAAWFALMPGLMLLDAVAGVPGLASAVPGVTLAAFCGLGLSAVSGCARDASSQGRSRFPRGRTRSRRPGQ